MKPVVALSCILASACVRPQLAHTGAEMAATASHKVAPNIVGATTDSPAGAHHYTAGAVVPHPVNHVAPSAPAVFTTGHQPASLVTKHVHLVGTSFVSGSATRIPKPTTPHAPISVPTVLKGSVPYNAPIVKGQIEIHRMQNPGLVERRAEVPCDVPECHDNIVKVPTPVHVDAPHSVHVPTPVAGEPTIGRTLLPYTHAVVPVEAPRLTVSLGAYQVKSENQENQKKNRPVYMMIFLWALLSLLAVNGESCNNVEDPIKRDEAATGPWNVSRVEWKPSGLQGALIPVTLGDSHPLGRTALYEGDSYVIQYAVREGRSPDVIYFWQGSSSSRFEKGASAILAVQVDDATGGRAKQARVVFGEEPSHFLNMMGGDFITLQGGVERKKPTVQDNDGVMLFRVQSQCNSVGSKKPLVRTNQVDEKVSSLNREDAFILLDTNKKSVFTWAAQGSSPEEKSTMAQVAKTIVDNAFKSLSTKPRVQNLTGGSPPSEITSKLTA